MEVGVHFSFDQQKSELREVKNLENIACTGPQLYINSKPKIACTVGLKKKKASRKLLSTSEPF